MAKYTGMMLGLCENYVKIGNPHSKKYISILVLTVSNIQRGFFLKLYRRVKLNFLKA